MQVGIDWAGLALQRATGLTLNQYLQKYVLGPLGIKNMSMIPHAGMREKLAYMNQRESDGALRPRDHLLRMPLVVDPDNEAEVARIFNSGGAGMFAKPQEYTREPRPLDRGTLLCGVLTMATRGPLCIAERWHLSSDWRPAAPQGDS